MLERREEVATAGEKALVTGGAGFIGSHLTERLCDLGYTVTVLDNLDSFYAGKNHNLAALKERSVRFVNGSILNRPLLSSLCRSASTVFHLAAQAGVRYCISHPGKAHRTNVNGTLNLLQACRKAAHLERVVNASSSSVYGKPAYLPLDEDHPKNPDSPYACSKLAAELYCNAFHTCYGLPIVNLRYFSVYGPRQRPDLVITSFARTLSRGRRPIIYGDGSQTRDFTYVTDIVEGTVKAASTDGVEGETFNLGRGEETDIATLCGMMASLLGVRMEPEYRPPYPGDFPHTKADIAKARRLLGYQPRVPIAEGLKRYVEWFKQRDQQEQ